NFRIGLAAGAFLLLAMLSGAVDAAEMLTNEQIRAVVAGNTVQGAMVATGPYAEFYQADGTIKGKDYTGVWGIDGDKMCFQYGSDPQSCWNVARDGDAVQWIKDGKVEGTGTVAKGNPNKF
ncbi:MAG TPA: hypothetical protein VHQ67_07015, partial [Nitrospiraceae bacterium]|nr:hypothetical protein [Nitrospiraceae bacterium]